MEKKDELLETLEAFLVKKIENFNEGTSVDEMQVVGDLVRVATVRKSENRKHNLVVNNTIIGGRDNE